MVTSIRATATPGHHSDFHSVVPRRRPISLRRVRIFSRAFRARNIVAYPDAGMRLAISRAVTPTEIGSSFHEPQYPVRTSSCRPNFRLIHRTVSKVMTPIDKKSKTGPNIIDHKVELPTIKACPTVFQLPECTLSQIGNPISQRTEMTAPIFCHLFVTEAGTPVTTDQWRGHSHEIFGLQAFAGDCRRPMREYRGPAPPARSNRVPRRP